MTEEKKQSNEKSTRTNDSDAKRKNVFEEFGDSVGRFATKTFDSIKQTIDKSLDSRNTVLTIRVNDDANKKLNMLVDAGIFKSRSESAAFLIEEGIKHQEGLFKKISEKLKKIEKIKDELKDIITEEMSDKEEC
jgi:Arc/MetJ-type ribon-helix-helix transcriptional regulator